MSSRCTGHCCKSFSLPISPEDWEVARQLESDGVTRDDARWSATGLGRVNPYQFRIVSDMLIFQAGPQGHSPIDECRQEGNADTDQNYFYTCKHHNAETGDCRIYARRPEMCRAYPYDGPCRYNSCGSSDRCQSDRTVVSLRLRRERQKLAYEEAIRDDVAAAIADSISEIQYKSAEES